jgi:voltage-gated potassium channel Kch
MLPLFFAIIHFFRAIGKELRDPEFQAFFLFVIILLVSGTLFYHSVEGWRYIDALYFSVVTLATVGFGDFSPQTDAGKFFTIVYIFIGVGVIFEFVGVVARHAQVSRSPVQKALDAGARKEEDRKRIA